jgi:hypothetical protein
MPLLPIEPVEKRRKGMVKPAIVLIFMLESKNTVGVE